MFKNKTILISGGTGSFGNAVLKKFINTDFNEIRIFSRDEKKQHDLREKLNNNKVKFFIGDVKDRPGHDNRYAVDSSKIKKIIGWKPKLKFEEGIKKTVLWYLDNKEWTSNIKTRNK
jgi:dTDP-D-glucose 4,6-dehydratase